MIGVGEGDDELGRVVGQTNDAVAVRQVHGKRRASADVVEAQRDHMALAPERVLEPGRLLRPPEPGQAHPHLEEPPAVSQPRCPRDPDPARGLALTERAGLARVRDEGRAAGQRLGLGALRAGVDRARRERQSCLPRHLESALLDGAAELGVGSAGHRLAVDRAGPEQIEVLRGLALPGGGRRHATEEHGNVDGPGLGPDVRPHEERPDREVGLGLARDEGLGHRLARRR